MISGSFECDRLDFVVRDIVNSGFAQGRLPYDRLISSMKMVQKDERFLFCPDVRSLSAIEDLYHLRWFLYKHIIGHRRVVKTDFLLGSVILQLAQDWMQENGEDHSIETGSEAASSQQILPADISGLWVAIKNVFLMMITSTL